MDIKKLQGKVNKGKQGLNKTRALVPKGAVENKTEESNGRKGESAFVTSYLSRTGNQNKNSDYFAYVELENFACWIVADGDDNESGSDEIAELTVKELVGQFIENPTLSPRKLKKFVKNVQNKLQYMKSKKREKIGMSTSFSMFVTDYTCARTVSVGNTRIYLIRDEIVIEKTADDSIAYIVHSSGDLEYEEIRFHSQRDMLTQSMGDLENVVPKISDKIPLFNGDKVIFMSHGSWENLDIKNIEIELSKAQSVSNWLLSLEKIIKENSDKNLANYTLAGVFINKVSPTGKKKIQFNYIKAILIMLGLFLLVFIIYTGYSLKQQREKSYETAYMYEEYGLKNIESGDYKKSLENFEKSKTEYKNLELIPKDTNILTKTIFSSKIINTNLEKQITLVDKKIDQLAVLDKVLNKMENGMEAYDQNQFDTALDIFEDAKKDMIELKGLNYNNIKEISKNIEKRIVVSKSLIIAYNLQREGNEHLNNNELNEAIKNYLEAKIIYLKFDKIDLLSEVSNKADQITKMRDEKFATAMEYERQAFEVEATDINRAILLLEMANGTYQSIGNGVRSKAVGKKLSKLRELKKLLNIESKEYLSQARVYTEAGRYEEALVNIEKTKEMSVKLKDEKKAASAMGLEGELYFDKKEYDLSYKKYQEAYSAAAGTSDNILKEELGGKIEVLKEVTYGHALEVEGDLLMSDEEYKDANKKYREAIIIYEGLEKNRSISGKQYSTLMDDVRVKEKKSWRESNWIPFF